MVSVIYVIGCVKNVFNPFTKASNESLIGIKLARLPFNEAISVNSPSIKITPSRKNRKEFNTAICFCFIKKYMYGNNPNIIIEGSTIHTTIKNIPETKFQTLLIECTPIYINSRYITNEKIRKIFSEYRFETNSG